MESYWIKSIIGEIAQGMERLIRKGVLDRSRKVLLYGLDQYAFAMRTILSNLGYHSMEGYISDDEALVAHFQTQVENFSCRFLSRRRDVLQVWCIEERLVPFDRDVVVLLASKTCEQEKAKLRALGYEENVHFYVVYDFRDRELENFFKGKPRMSLPEIKQAEKEMLFYVDGLCQKYGLRYWVCGGTLLGTIRHKGFIPWDDDIDIFLPWRDYQKLMTVFEKTERYGLLGFGTAEVNDFPAPFAKVVDKRTVVDEDVGTVRKINPLWIDVFPLVGMPEDAGRRSLFFAGYKELERQIWQEFYATNGRIDIFGRWFGRQKEFLARYDFDQASYVGVLGTVYGEKDCTSRRVYDKTLRMPFEDIEVNVPAGYKEYLDRLYGCDWMKPPKESERKSHHNMAVYWSR